MTGTSPHYILRCHWRGPCRRREAGRAVRPGEGRANPRAKNNRRDVVSHHCHGPPDSSNVIANLASISGHRFLWPSRFAILVCVPARLKMSCLASRPQSKSPNTHGLRCSECGAGLTVAERTERGTSQTENHGRMATMVKVCVPNEGERCHGRPDHEGRRTGPGGRGGQQNEKHESFDRRRGQAMFFCLSLCFVCRSVCSFVSLAPPAHRAPSASGVRVVSALRLVLYNRRLCVTGLGGWVCMG